MVGPAEGAHHPGLRIPDLAQGHAQEAVGLGRGDPPEADAIDPLVRVDPHHRLRGHVAMDVFSGVAPDELRPTSDMGKTLDPRDADGTEAVVPKHGVEIRGVVRRAAPWIWILRVPHRDPFDRLLAAQAELRGLNSGEPGSRPAGISLPPALVRWLPQNEL
ncbi:hypothetical protein [Synechococcus sp. CBW1006]|uniref:hypothetical protein n=1 Tax=Synechococcus sp. CBW1006 TaxID=1353138 RepID=UPI0018CCCC52|nr:hypothetical protein [Synechococcus sp. CBW1006]QPN65860.1 hypothetical protein H8F26_13305 [Synechococcus sp. CBW1006]